MTAETKNIRLTIEYDGTDFHGWQRQASDRTVQQEIETALLTITGETVTLYGSGRTDAGVHALGQVANFLSSTRLDIEAMHKGLNSLLPNDIVIRECAEVDAEFHARYDVKSKLYCYWIRNLPLPTAIDRRYLWHIRKSLDRDAMQAAAAHVVGSHDFKAFEGTGSPRSNTDRTVFRAEWREMEDGNLSFEIEADGFLRFMVRNIVGTLVDAGLGKISTEEFKDILESKDRTRAGATAPPQGLFLVQVNY